MKVLDLETWPITEDRKAPKPVCVGYGTEIIRWEDWKGFDNEAFIGCFLPYDMACIAHHRPGGLEEVFDQLERGRPSDIAVREQLLDIEKGLGTKRKYSLSEIYYRRFGREIEKENTPRLEYWRLDGKPTEEYPQEFKDYLLRDLTAPLEIYEAQEREKYLNRKWEAFEVYSSFVLYLISSWGIRADKAWVDKLLHETGLKYAALQDKFRKLGVLREDGTQDKKALQALVSEAYRGNPPRTDKGNIRVDKVTLAESGDKLLEELTGDGPVTKIVSTYGDVLKLAVHHPYCAKYNVLVSSGRTSGNFQQWPRGGPDAPDVINRLRGSFVPRPGYVFCSCDLTAAELGSLAQVVFTLFGYSSLRAAINAGQDLHSRLASRFLGVGYEEGIALKKAGDKQFKNLRQAAKPVNFGVPGLMGAFRMVSAAQKDGAVFCELNGETDCIGSKCRKCFKYAKSYLHLYNKEWPDVSEYHRWVEKQDLDSFVSPCTGFVRGKLFPSEAANHSFQHLTSRCTKLAIQRLARKMYTDKSSALYGSRMVAFYHDEAFAELPEDRAVDAAWEMAKIVEDSANEFTPDVKADCKPALMRRWYKAAETVYDEKGKLTIWNPPS